MDAAKKIVCSLVLSRFDYCNSILSGSPKCLIQKLQSSKCSCTDYTKDAKNWTYYASSENVTLATNIQWNCLQDWPSMSHCADYCISKISVRAVECVYTSKTTALIIGFKYPQHCRSKDKVIWTTSICVPGTHQLEQGPWWNLNCGRKEHIQKTFKYSTISAECIR